MSEKRKWGVALGGGALLAAGLAGGIYYEHTRIVAMREEMAQLETEIQTGRTVVATTPELEREVIIQRETDAVIQQILPNDEDITNFVRTLQAFGEEAEVKITSVKNKKTNARDQKDFDKVTYSLAFDADAFHLLSFLHLTEAHPRFMSVPSLTLSSSRGNSRDTLANPAHKVQLDVETYVYTPRSGEENATIDNYERKRELLISEINRRRAELSTQVYEYEGPRGRRDPFVDPRVPAIQGDGPVLSIEQQIALVDQLVERTDAVWSLWEEAQSATTLIAEMRARKSLDEDLVVLEQEVDRIAAENQLLFLPSERRFQREVVARLEMLRTKLTETEGDKGPSLESIQEVASTVQRYLDAGDFEQALSSYEAIEPRLELIGGDREREVVVTRLRELAHKAEAVLEFENFELQIGGVALYEGQHPVALIGGRSVQEGDYIDKGGELVILSIHEEEIVFLFRGVAIARRIEV